MLLLCPDTPLGRWEERHVKIQEILNAYGPISTRAVNTPMTFTELSHRGEEKPEATDDEPRSCQQNPTICLAEAASVARAETVFRPSSGASLPVIFSLQTLFHVATYSCPFGGELAVNSMLNSYYHTNFPHLNQTKASDYATIFGFLVRSPVVLVASNGRLVPAPGARDHVCNEALYFQPSRYTLE